MAVVATGSLADRPIGRTLATVAQRRFDGELTVRASGKAWTIVWREGYIVGATGAHPADSAVKVALGAGLVSSSKASEILSALAASAGRDDIDVVAEVGKLAPEHVVRLRRRVVANRAMRLFALEEGELVLDTDVTSTPPPDMVPVDARVIIYQGALAHLTDARFKRDLATVGDVFQLRDDVAGALETFGFGDTERPVLVALSGRTLSPSTLVQAAPDVEPRVTMAVVYALAMWGYVESAGPRITGQVAVAAAAPPVAPAPSPDVGASRAPGAQAAAAPAAAAPAAPRPRSPTRQKVASGRTKASLITDGVAIRALVAERLQAVERKADHFAVLGVPPDASAAQIRAAYFDLARQLHPDRITAIGLEDVRAAAHRVFAQVNAAFGVLSNVGRRAEYERVRAAGGEAAIQRREDAAEELAERMLAAEEHFRLGEMALRRNQLDVAIAEAQRAVELNPQEGEHHALWGWATWCASMDRKAIANQVHVALETATRLAPKNPQAFLYLGKIARAEGNDDHAAHWLRLALQAAPGHAEASAELRVVELHLAGKPRSRRQSTIPAPTTATPAAAPGDDGPKKPGGLFGRFKR